MACSLYGLPQHTHHRCAEEAEVALLAMDAVLSIAMHGLADGTPAQCFHIWDISMDTGFDMCPLQQECLQIPSPALGCLF